MEYTVLNNGIKMPMAGIGTFLLTPDEAETSVLAALENGYRLIDTANAYVNEKAVGRAMKKSGLPREEILNICEIKPTVLQTEVHPYFQENELKAFLAEQDIKIQAWYPLGHVMEDIRKNCKGAEIAYEMEIQFDSAGGAELVTPEEKIVAWIDRIKE